MSRRGSPFNYPSPNDVAGQRLSTSRQGQENNNMDAQRSLQEASAALETAFDRIRQVRRNLLRFSETLPVYGATPATTTTRDGISPGHEALLLSGSPTENERGESSNLSSEIAPSQPWSTTTTTTTTDNREMVRPPHISAPVSPSIRPTSTGYNPPPLLPPPQHPYTTDLPTFLQIPPVPSVVPPRFSRQTTFNNQPGAGAETAATTHGLRVAAREANSSVTDMYRDRTMELASLAADYDRRFRAAAAPFNSLPPPPLDDFGLVSMRRDGRRYRSMLPSPPIPYSTSATSPRTGEVYRSHWQWDRYPAMPDPLGNPPVLDRSSRQNYLPRPPVIQHARSTVMPMPSNAPVFPMGPPPPPPPPPFVPSPNARNRPPTGDPYAMISGLETGNSNSNNGSGFDNPDWTSEEFISWLFPQEHTPSLVPRRDPQNPDTIRITRTTEGGSPPMPAGPRRRGWGMSVSLLRKNVIGLTLLLLSYSST